MDATRAITRRALLQRATAAGAALAFGQLAACSSSDDSETTPATSHRGPKPSPSAPNVVVILADDMRHDEVEHMPNVTRLLLEQGVGFTAARHNISLCSPARAGFLTGQYSKRHGVRSQHDSFGKLNDESKTIAVWMQDAGYDTGIVGKYFTGGNRSAPGWRFRRQLSTGVQQQYGFTVWDGERATKPEVDQTRYLRDEVLDFLGTALEPFLLWFTPTANHWPLEPPPGHEDDAASLEWPDNREEDVSDKPAWIRSLPQMTDQQLRAIRMNQQLRVRELLGLDDTIAGMFSALEARGSLENTVVVFSSDNGVFEGEHRLPLLMKNLPYDPSVRVPCFLRAPGLPHGVVTQPAHMAIDLTATCVDVAGARPDLALDGVSLLDIANSPSRYDDRRLLYDRDDRDDGEGLSFPPAAGVFTARQKLVRYDTTPPTYELYDLARDPNELENVADDPSYAVDRSALEADLNTLLSS